jgi:hypothetical protein
MQMHHHLSHLTESGNIGGIEIMPIDAAHVHTKKLHRRRHPWFSPHHLLISGLAEDKQENEAKRTALKSACNQSCLRTADLASQYNAKRECRLLIRMLRRQVHQGTKPDVTALMAASRQALLTLTDQTQVSGMHCPMAQARSCTVNTIQVRLDPTLGKEEPALDTLLVVYGV